MQYLSNGSDDERTENLALRHNPRFPDYAQQPLPPFNATDEQVGATFNFRYLLRKYWLWLGVLMLFGAAAGFASVLLTSPRYKSRLLLEVQNVTGTFMKNDGASMDTNEVGIQTQVTLLRSGSFLRRGTERVQSDSVPLAPTGRDTLSRLRQRIHPTTQDPLEAYKVGLAMATSTFDARPVTRTRLIELSCESTSPDVAAQFLNAMAQEFVEDNNRSRIQIAQKTGEWLARQLDETKSRVQEAEARMREFAAASGNVFVGPDATLDDTKLNTLKVELSKIQGERIAKQTRYELTTKSSPESLAEILDDSVLRGYKVQLEGLKREKAVLETTYTSKHEKVRKVESQIAMLQRSYDTELNNTVKRIKNDYDAALKQERLLNQAYTGQAQRVGSEASNAAQYAALRREADTQRQMYQTLLVQQSEANMSSSVPVNPIRIVEQAVAPEAPYKPQPVLNISFGTIFGLALSAGLIFLTERADRSIKAPGLSRRLFNTPELGVIPNFLANGHALPKRLLEAGAQDDLSLNGSREDIVVAQLPASRNLTFITESFRSTLASILRSQASGRAQKTILVSSPGPAEGKTTVVQNLGIVLAETGRKVLLIDADFRRPHLHRKFSLPNEWGLIDLLCDDRALSDYLPEELEVPTGIPGLSILPNRVTQNNVAKSLYSPRFRTLMQMLVGRYDMILVDAPPILGIADARIIAPLTDAIILVLRCGATDRDAALTAHQTIQEDGLTLLGTVLTDYDMSLDRKHQYYYDYGNPSRA